VEGKGAVEELRWNDLPGTLQEMGLPDDHRGGLLQKILNLRLEEGPEKRSFQGAKRDGWPNRHESSIGELWPCWTEGLLM